MSHNNGGGVTNVQRSGARAGEGTQTARRRRGEGLHECKCDYNDEASTERSSFAWKDWLLCLILMRLGV